MKKELKNPKLLSSGDARKLLGVSYQFIEQLVERGKLPFFQTACGKIFREGDVLKFKREREKRAKTDRRIRLRR